MRSASPVAIAICCSCRLPLLPCETSIITCSGKPAARSTAQLADTPASSQFGALPPRRMTWQIVGVAGASSSDGGDAHLEGVPR